MFGALYYDKQKSRNVKITESDGLEMTMLEKWQSEAVNNGDEKTDR